MKAEIGVMPLQAEDHQRTPAANRSSERGQEQTHPQPSEGTNPADTFITDLWSPELGDNTPLWFKPPSLQSFIMMAISNPCT